MTSDCGDMRAPDGPALTRLAGAALATIPDHLRAHTTGLAIRVLEFADEDTCKSLGIDDPFELLGLYDGVALTEQSTSLVAEGPDTVILYRRPILDLWAEGDDTLGHIVTHILIHEIGHHFGFSDADMEALEGEV